MSQAFDVNAVVGGLYGPAVGWNVRFLPVVASTMDEVRALAGTATPHGTVVVADEQTAGRGRLGRAWDSRPGGNLYFTALLRVPLEVLRLLPMAVPLAVAEAIDEVAGLTAALKWPNDVQLRGKKCAGVLLDSQTAGIGDAIVLAGIGINVNRDPADNPELREIATSISAELGRPVGREALLAAVLNRVAVYSTGPDAGIVPRWRARLNTLGRSVRVRSGDQVLAGTAEGVGDDGSLLLRLDDGALVALAAGEVSLRG